MSKKSSILGVVLGLAVLSQNVVTGVPRLTVRRGNRKIARNVAVWSVIAPDACPGMGICGLFCYAFKVLKGLNGVVLASFRSNYEATFRDDFVDRMVDKLSKLKDIVAVRVHDAGDFYCQGYIMKWVEIAKQLPYLKFFANTKSLCFDLSPLESLPNFTLIKSEGGIFDRLIDKTKDNYAVVAENAKQAKKQAKLVGGKVCPPELLGLKLAGKNKRVWCGNKCNYCLQKNHQIKVFFVQQNAGWNGFPEDPDMIRRLRGLVEHGFMVPTTATQRRRLNDFKRRYPKPEVRKGGASC